jgi:adenylosuccinate synthase
MANLNVLNDLADEKYHILEGAQGLGLDEELGVMPHCTHSKTGLPQAISTAQYELAQTGVQPIYVTRCYTTRHGAGPLHGEGSFITDAKLYDETNQPNPWQDTIRFAPLDLQLLSSHIKRDLARVNYHGVAQLALTCLDQLGTNVTVYDIDGKLQTISSSILPSFVQQQMAPVARLKYIARGPRARDVTQLRS